MLYSGKFQKRRGEIKRLSFDGDSAGHSCVEGEGKQPSMRIFPQHADGGSSVHGKVVGHDEEDRIFPGGMAFEICDEFAKCQIGTVDSSEQLRWLFAGQRINRAGRTCNSIWMMCINGHQSQQKRLMKFAQGPEFFRPDAKQHGVSTTSPFSREAVILTDFLRQVFCCP